jgi:hypothetical protein
MILWQYLKSGNQTDLIVYYLLIKSPVPKERRVPFSCQQQSEVENGTNIDHFRSSKMQI